MLVHKMVSITTLSTKLLKQKRSHKRLHGCKKKLKGTLLHCVSKNDTHVTHYRFNPHQRISVIFGRDVAERICY